MLKGEEIYLRPLIKDDLDYLNRWKNDEEVYRFLGGGFQPVSIDQQAKWMDSMIDQTGNTRRFMIVEDTTPIGMGGLYYINWIHRTCEIGIYIGDCDKRGKGYAYETCTLLENFAADYLNMRKIKLQAVADNTAGIALWKKLGYVQAGILRKERFIQGKYHDLVIMEKFLIQDK